MLFGCLSDTIDYGTGKSSSYKVNINPIIFLGRRSTAVFNFQRTTTGLWISNGMTRQQGSYCDMLESILG